MVQKAGLGPAWKTWNSPAGESPDTLVLTAPAPLAGVVVDEKGQPIAGAEVSATLAVQGEQNLTGRVPNILFGQPARDAFSARTEADGRFRIANFPAKAQADLTAIKAGKTFPASNINNLNSLPYHSGRDDIRLAMETGGSVEGKVTARDTGSPIAHVKLRLQPTGNGFMPDFTQPPESGADGTFRIMDTSAGVYSLMAEFAGESGEWVAEPVTVTVAAGETTRDVSVQAVKGAELDVKVVAKKDRSPVPDVNITAYRPPGTQTSATTDAKGEAVLHVLPGQLTVVAMKEGWSQAQSQANVNADQKNAVQIELNAPLKITGMVHVSSGAAVANVAISVTPNYGGNSGEVKSDAGGHYEISWQMPAYAGMGNQPFYLIARSPELNLAAMHEVTARTTNLDLQLATRPCPSRAKSRIRKGNPSPAMPRGI